MNFQEIIAKKVPARLVVSMASAVLSLLHVALVIHTYVVLLFAYCVIGWGSQGDVQVILQNVLM